MIWFTASTLMNQKGSLARDFICQVLAIGRDGLKLFLSSNYKSWEREFRVGPVWGSCASLVQPVVPKDVGSSRKSMAAKTLPMDGCGGLSACDLD